MKVVGFIVIMLGLILAFIGITGSQHRIMNIIKGVHPPQPGGTDIASNLPAGSNQTQPPTSLKQGQL